MTVEPSMHNGDEWECSFADNGLSIKSNRIRIKGSNLSHTETEQKMCTVEVNNGRFEIKVTSNEEKDIFSFGVDEVDVGICDTYFDGSRMLAHTYKNQYNITFTPSKQQCIFTIFKLSVTPAIVYISSEAKAMKEVLIDGKAIESCKDPSIRIFILKANELESHDSIFPVVVIAGIVLLLIAALIGLTAGLVWKLLKRKLQVPLMTIKMVILRSKRVHLYMTMEPMEM
ncbi:uncharacterized protein LOC128222524 [Mya arenaria]|uniref:uncharacterized protein LOC128222524 n=1 Tax=Mya arenaria TaxID=6604 RepID=UPI0022E61556|nr:uncharacterized protein LOC128222524 [Mya arenaria]